MPGIDKEKCAPRYERIHIWVPENHSVKTHTDEELLKRPLIMQILHLIQTGQADKICCRFNNSEVVSNEAVYMLRNM